MSENKNNGNEKKGLRPLDTLPKVVAQITINLHQGGRVTGEMPTDPKILFYMVGEFLKQIGPMLVYNPPSPIVAPPPGFVIPGSGSRGGA
jgi:hypothetical protein